MLNLDNPFWRFSLAVYARPGVQAECLAAQDERGADVNVLLYCAWLGAAHGIALDADGIARSEAAVARWSEAAVLPLRRVRCTIKTLPEMDEPAVQSLRREIAAAELEAERIEQALLFAIAPAASTLLPLPLGEAVALVGSNLAAYLAGLQTNSSARPGGTSELQHIIAAAVGVAGQSISTPPGA